MLLVIGTVDALESGTFPALLALLFSLKLPSGLVTMQEVTPLALQKIEVLETRFTEAGDAQMPTFAGPRGAAGVLVAATGAGFGFETRAVVAAVCIGTIPMENLALEQRPSKKDGFIWADIRGFCHGLIMHMRATSPRGSSLPVVFAPKNAAVSMFLLESRASAKMVAPVCVT